MKFWASSTDGEAFDFNRAVKQLIHMEPSLKTGKFNISDWLPGKAKECRLETQAEKWIDEKSLEASKGDLSYETLKDYKGYIKNHFIPLLQMDIRQIGYDDIKRMSDGFSYTLKAKTRRNILNGLHALFSWMKRKGSIKEIPSFPIVSGNDSETRTALEYSDQAIALTAIPERHRAIIEFGFETGLRPGETCALQIGDIDFKRGEAIIQRTWSGSRLRETTKGKNKLAIPLSDKALKIVSGEIKGRMEGQIVSFSIKDQFIFINPDTDRAYRPKKLNQIWQRYSGTGIDHYSASRHSFCSQIVESGADALEAQRLLRHADLRSTQKYFHASAAKLKTIVNNRHQSVRIGKGGNGT